MEALRADGRRGVTALYERLVRRKEKGDREARRLAMLRRHEMELWNEGLECVAGVDEAGRGPLAGPVVAAAVVLPRELRIDGLDDSKRLSPEKRERLYDVIQKNADAVAVGSASEKAIDEMNILRATHRAMRDAVLGLSLAPEHVLVDGDAIPELTVAQTGIRRGDEVSAPIAAASIIAKVTRDRAMVELDARYPGYGFAKHKGYGTREHVDALQRLGPCEIHRRSFRIVLEAAGGYSPLYTRFRDAFIHAEDTDEIERVADAVAREKAKLAPFELSKLRALYKRAHRRTRLKLRTAK
jgi:ribonuclease HII